MEYGLIGGKLGHSYSKTIHELLCGYSYELCPLPTEADARAFLQRRQFKAINVTIPYKEKIIPYMNELSEEARHIGAVNVVRIGMRKGKPHLKGFNSDVIGFTRSIEPLLEPIHRKALILGTGGASKAVRYGLHRLGIETRFVSRNPKEDSLTYPQLTPEIMDEYKVIVNCTPVGMYPHTEECPALPYTAIGRNHLLYDLVYNPEETLFLRKGREQGAITKNGLEMLILQAYAGWEFWHSED